MTLRDLHLISLIGLGAAVGATHLAQAQGTSAHAHDAAIDGHAQANDSTVAAFVLRTREATKMYHDLDAAVASGYRLLGPDFPGMGEHWVHIHRAVHGGFEADRPAVLTYAHVGGRRILTGIAYTQPVRPGEAPPELDLPADWHFHSGTVDEETLLLNPRSMHHAADDEPRLAMLHAWVWVENPAGLFEQDNWALPFLRLGLPVPETIPPQAGKALFLLTGGAAYYAKLIDVAGQPSLADETAVLDVLADFHDRVESRHVAMQLANVVTETDVEWLTAQWHELWIEIERVVRPEVWSEIEMLSG